MKPPKVSFDFDDTLSHPHVQEYAKQLLDQGVEVWIITTRYDENHMHKYAMDYPATLDDLWAVALHLGIPKHHVRFTCMEWKYTYLNGTEFLWHLDDNPHEIRRAQYNKCKVPMIQVHGGGWQKKCNGLLLKYKAKHEAKTDV